ncbi:hypothetical protein N018_15745 [Pseudomonas syringae CC1557]|uniref:Uncharacterized protein n=1 Tax=Pseudomonas syringae CC1557 TaxID=1357279 RepID=W0N3K1_PSESX|nr:hypothetical protein N018_15745 [Pseudomonas syringae CC1557]
MLSFRHIGLLDRAVPFVDDSFSCNALAFVVPCLRSFSDVARLRFPTPPCSTVPLLAFATLSYEQEQPLVWRSDRLPTITLKANVLGKLQPTALVKQLKPEVEAFSASLPLRYSVATGGAVEASTCSQGPILKVVPLMLLLVVSHGIKRPAT